MSAPRHIAWGMAIVFSGLTLGNVWAVDCELTPPNPQGPYWFEESPERSNLRETGDGPLLDLHLEVVDRNCVPIPGAWIDIWHPDSDGVYDNKAWGYRGHHYVDDQGVSLLETIIPGIYPGRTRHIHVKVQGSTGNVHTTQMYFPDVPENDTDWFYLPELEVEVLEVDKKGNMIATFRFVLDEDSVNCYEDVNQDGQVDVNDLLSVIAAWGPCKGWPEDIDESGTVDVSDLLAIIAAWGPCE